MKFWNQKSVTLTLGALLAAFGLHAGAGSALGQSENGADDGVEVSEYMTVDIFVQDEDLGNVLQMLSKQTKKNIVASKDVSGTVTANFYNVTFEEALTNILNINGYGWKQDGNFIYVRTLADLEAAAAAERKVVSRVVQLDYLNASDAAAFAEPLLSSSGTIKASGDVSEFSIPDDAPVGAEDFALAATIVIFDFEENVEEILKLLEQLDTRPAQVLVEATIVQTSLTEANAFGVDFAFLNGLEFLDFFNFGGPLGAADALSQLGENDVAPIDNRATSVVSRPGNFAGPGTLKTAILHDDIALFIRALDEVSDTTVLSNPKILALNRQSARVLVGRKLGYLSTTSTETATTQTVEFLDTGTQLNFRPFISNDGLIRLELKPRVSEGIIRDATDATGAAVTIPDEVTQEITTNVMVPDGATVVLGGLFREQTQLTRRQVPVLGDLPVVGTAFRGFDDSTDRSEIIFLIKPTVVSDRVLLTEAELALDHAERIRVGSRHGLLPWSRDRQTAQLNVQAERLAAEGDLERANWTLRRSLELNPNQPDALRLRERISGQYEYYPSRSLLHDYVNGEVRERYEPIPNEPPASGASGAEPMSRSTDRNTVITPLTKQTAIMPPIEHEPVVMGKPEAVMHAGAMPTPRPFAVTSGGQNLAWTWPVPDLHTMPKQASSARPAPAVAPQITPSPAPGTTMTKGPDGKMYHEMPTVYSGPLTANGAVSVDTAPAAPATPTGKTTSAASNKPLSIEQVLKQIAQSSGDPAIEEPVDETDPEAQVSSVDPDSDD